MAATWKQLGLTFCLSLQLHAELSAFHTSILNQLQVAHSTTELVAVLHCKGECDQALLTAHQVGKLWQRQTCLHLSAFPLPWGFCVTCSLKRRAHVPPIMLDFVTQPCTFGRTLCTFFLQLFVIWMLPVCKHTHFYGPFGSHISYMLYLAMPSVKS